MTSGDSASSSDSGSLKIPPSGPAVLLHLEQVVVRVLLLVVFLLVVVVS